MPGTDATLHTSEKFMRTNQLAWRATPHALVLQDFYTYGYGYVSSALQASMIVADATESLNITGNGDVLSPHDGILCKYSNLKYTCCQSACVTAAVI